MMLMLKQLRLRTGTVVWRIKRVISDKNPKRSVSRIGFLLLAVVLLTLAATAQEFEVASVKPNPGGQGSNTRMNFTADGIRYIAVPLRWIVAAAYDIPHTQVFGPDWIFVEA